ncbi:MAG: hypothetical protein O3A84_16635 [Proteobacteria bacterium]|nr:hypothetical protein [Pseudomonadota bacterium]
MAKRLLDAGDGNVTHQGFHEAASVCIKLSKMGVLTPFVPILKDKIDHDTFGDDLINYFAAIEPHLRDGDLETTKWFAATAIKLLFNERDALITPDEADQPQSPPKPGP